MNARAPRGAPTTRARVREVFSGEGFRRYFAARTISQLGDGLFQLASVAVVLFENPGANPAIPLFAASAITLVPFSVIAPFTGVFIDRWERRKILFWVPVLRACTAATIPLAAHFGKQSPMFYAVVLLVLSANRFFLATMSAVLPQLVPEGDLIVANSAATTGGAIANVTGQAIGSALAHFIGGEYTALVAAGFFAASTFMTMRIPVRPGRPPKQAPLGEQLRAVAHELGEGLRAVRGRARVVYGLVAITFVQFLVGVMIAVLTYFFIHTLDLTIEAAAPLLAFLAVGIGVGVVLVPIAARFMRTDMLLPASFALAAAGAAVGAFTLSRATAGAGAVLVGIAYAFAKIPVDTIVQEEMADELRGRAFTVYDMLFNVARVAGIGAVAIAYANHADNKPIIGVAAVLYICAAMGFGTWARRIGVRQTGTAQEGPRDAPATG
jgi:predicted MFS family arabinose efflux permease